jgi:hypothetical protein
MNYYFDFEDLFLKRSLCRIRDEKNVRIRIRDPGWRNVGIRILDKTSQICNTAGTCHIWPMWLEVMDRYLDKLQSIGPGVSAVYTAVLGAFPCEILGTGFFSMSRRLPNRQSNLALCGLRGLAALRLQPDLHVGAKV